MLEEKEEALSHLNLYKKILDARGMIKSTKIKRSGFNQHSKYEYFTPDQVTTLVNEACQKFGLLHFFSLKEDEIGLYGELVIIDVESGDFISSTMRTKMPSITATNDTQKMGGCNTFTRRYMLMDAFDIADNSLDFDAQDNRDEENKSESNVKGLKKRSVKKIEDKDHKTIQQDEKIGTEKLNYDEIIANLNVYETSVEVRNISSELIQAANDNHLPMEKIEDLKKAINTRYKLLKSQEQEETR